MATANNTNVHHDHHDHGHHHHHNHGDHSEVEIEPQEDASLSVTEKNKRFWDAFAAKYRSDDWQEQINKIVEFINSNINWIGIDFLDSGVSFERSNASTKTVRVLDYACGPGTITDALGSRATEYIGIDLSDNMIKAYNARFAAEPDAERINAHGVVGNLLDEEELPTSFSGPEFFNFDLVAVGLGFHHFENLPHVTQRLVDRLKPGGVLFIIDLVTHEKEDTHSAAHTVVHHGFSEDEVKKLFGGAGLVDVDVIRMNGQILMRGISPRTPFMARGRKPVK